MSNSFDVEKLFLTALFKRMKKREIERRKTFMSNGRIMKEREREKKKKKTEIIYLLRLHIDLNRKENESHHGYFLSVVLA